MSGHGGSQEGSGRKRKADVVSVYALNPWLIAGSTRARNNSGGANSACVSMTWRAREWTAARSTSASTRPAAQAMERVAAHSSARPQRGRGSEWLRAQRARVRRCARGSGRQRSRVRRRGRGSGWQRAQRARARGRLQEAHGEMVCEHLDRVPPGEGDRNASPGRNMTFFYFSSCTAFKWFWWSFIC
jgi:hypothetical protein